MSEAARYSRRYRERQNDRLADLEAKVRVYEDLLVALLGDDEARAALLRALASIAPSEPDERSPWANRMWALVGTLGDDKQDHAMRQSLDRVELLDTMDATQELGFEDLASDKPY